MHEQHENINKNIGTMNKNKIEILRLKNAITLLKILLHGLKSKFDQVKIQQTQCRIFKFETKK